MSSVLSKPQKSLWLLAVAASTTVAVAAGTWAYRKWQRQQTQTTITKKKKQPLLDPPKDKDGLVLERFEKCVIHMKVVLANANAKLPQATQLELYGWYKQATLGDADAASKPPAYDLVASAKYHAWQTLTGMERTAAMQLYIDKAILIEFTREMQQQDNNDGEGLMGDAIMDMNGLGMRPSTLNHNDDEDDEEEGKDETATLFPLHHAARENHLETLERLLVTMDADTLDTAGQTALHLAADRGNKDAIHLLKKAGANVSAADHDGISVLQAAVIGGNVECCRLLCQLGADPDQPDRDGDTPRNCAHDDPTLREMLLLFRATLTGPLVLLTVVDHPDDSQQEWQALGPLPVAAAAVAVEEANTTTTTSTGEADAAKNDKHEKPPTREDLNVFDQIDLQLDDDGDI